MSAASNPYEPPRSDLLPVAETGRPANAFGDSPIATFESVPSKTWLLRAFNRWFKFHRPYGLTLYGWVLFPLVSYKATSLFGRIPEAEQFTSAKFWLLVAVNFLILAPLSVWLDRYINWLYLLRNFRQFNHTVTVTLYREGLMFTASEKTITNRWWGLRSAVRYSDGILLNAGMMQFHWLPFDDLKTGNIDDIDALMKTTFPSYQQRRA